jgi:hypothetical protein
MESYRLGKKVIKQFCVYSHNPCFVDVLEWLRENKIKLEAHVNRTRFWIDSDSPEMAMFMLTHRRDCEPVDEDQDYTTGRK